MSTVGRRDRTGELINVEDLEPDWRHRCRGGWVDPDADLPVPCRLCRPWLAAPRPRPPMNCDEGIIHD
jgi:hypothetical protein